MSRNWKKKHSNMSEKWIKQSIMLKNCKNTVKNIEKPSTKSKTRRKTVQNYVKLSTNPEKC